MINLMFLITLGLPFVIIICYIITIVTASCYEKTSNSIICLYQVLRCFLVLTDLFAFCNIALFRFVCEIKINYLSSYI